MVISVFFGVGMIGIGIYALVRPMSVRSFPRASEWKDNSEQAEQEQRAYASMMGFFLILIGLILLVVGLLRMVSL